ncbi:ribose-phosphate diphosphokinase [Pollutibacter soli]|uniref:ribose-phosphate diphosphokinase n=1 Tax=Pollutibacter soli TaxID=3034157 RepID=UPI00301332BF
MYALNLDRNFKFRSDEQISYESFTFSGGEPHVKINAGIDTNQPIALTQRINSFNELGMLCMAVDALKRMGATIEELYIPCFPGARQDRVMVTGEPLSVKVYADIINCFKAAKVFVFDPHSEVTSAVLNNSVSIPNHKFIKKMIELLNVQPLLISPDGGALKKIYKLSEFLGGAEVVECSKSRDIKTGSLTGFKVYSNDLKGADCLIVDDICDGGATFTGLAAELKNKNAGRLFLAVSHGIFSRGFDGLLNHFDIIFTTDSIREIIHPRVQQLKLSDGLFS